MKMTISYRLIMLAVACAVSYSLKGANNLLIITTTAGLSSICGLFDDIMGSAGSTLLEFRKIARESATKLLQLLFVVGSITIVNPEKNKRIDETVIIFGLLLIIAWVLNLERKNLAGIGLVFFLGLVIATVLQRHDTAESLSIIIYYILGYIILGKLTDRKSYA